MKKVKAASILEFVIALTIIGICLSVATLIFSRSTKSTTRFQEVQEETVFQSDLMEAFMKDTLVNVKSWKGELYSIKELTEKKEKALKHVYSLEYSGSIGWTQDLYERKK